MNEHGDVIDWDKVYEDRPEPDLARGDLIRVPDYSSDAYLVDGLRAHGMLVDATPIQGGQQFCFPINTVFPETGRPQNQSARNFRKQTCER